jgi:IS30 family transposase
VGRWSRWEYLREIFARYRRAPRKEKSRILSGFCEVAEYNRKYALRLLNGKPPKRVPPDKRKRRSKYSRGVVEILRVIWEAANYPWSLRLKALIPLWLPRVKKHMDVSSRQEKELLAISPRQIDRRLGPYKKQVKRRLYGRTKPGTLLKHQIPIKAERWQTTEPGFGEIDLVSHSGDRADGEFINTLTFTDIHSTWTETRAVMGKSQAFVQEALEDIKNKLPFPMRGIDSDNGSEFINHHLMAYCKANGIEFTRSRPYKKDDNAHVEQKNWTHVRKLFGYLRYDSEQAQLKMNDLYRGDLRLFQNLFLPSVKLVAKTRVGSRLRRSYDSPKTPLDRLLDSGGSNLKRATLRALRNRLDPLVLSSRVDKKLREIHALSNVRYNPKARERTSKGGYPGMDQAECARPGASS